MPVYIKDGLHLDPRWIGLCATMFLLVEGLMKSPFGILGDRVGRKVLIMSGPAVSAVTAFLTPLVHHPFGLVGLRIVDGLGAAALWPACFSLIGDRVPEKNRSSAMSMFNVAYISGVALGPYVGGRVNDWAHEHLHLTLAGSKSASFYAASVLFAITVIVAAALVPGGRPQDTEHAHAPQSEDGGFNLRDIKRMLVRIPATLLMAFVTFCGIGLVMAYVKVFVTGQFHISETAFGSLLLVPALAIAALSIPLGTMGDRIGKVLAVRIGVGICAVSYWAAMAFASIPTLLVFGTLIGIGFVIAFPSWMAIISSDCEPGQRGAVIGAVGTAQGLGALFGAAVSGTLYNIQALQLGPITIPHNGVPFVGCGVLLACSFVLALTTVKTPSQTAESVAR
jgi:DHA1 family multidrug resistance protein-like MFS transporter